MGIHVVENIHLLFKGIKGAVVGVLLHDTLPGDRGFCQKQSNPTGLSEASPMTDHATRNMDSSDRTCAMAFIVFRVFFGISL